MQVAITVKAYPEASGKYGEAVCVAGLRIDRLLAPPTWVRLYPIQFRELPQGLQFAKYDIVDLATKPSSDTRPESRHPVADSIRILGSMRSSQRREMIQAMELVTTCDLRRENVEKTGRRSLGLVKPADVEPVTTTRLDDDEITSRRIRRAETLAQLSLFGERPDPAEVIPYEFRYPYRCGHPTCGGHEQRIIDWEIHQAFRRWRHTYDDPVAQIRAKWDEMTGAGRDTHFYVGNMAARPHNFMVLGVYAPVIASGR